MDLKDPWDFEEVYGALHDFARGYPFDTDAEDYLVNITTGTHVAQICWFLLTEARYHPGQAAAALAAASGWRRRRRRRLRASSISTCRATTASPRASAPSRREATSFLKSGIATRNPAFNRMIDRIEQVAIRSQGAAPADRADRAPASRSWRGASTSSRRLRQQIEGAVRRGELRHPARRRGHVGAVRPRARAPSPAPSATAPGCCARPTAACCSSTRSASSASTSRR